MATEWEKHFCHLHECGTFGYVPNMDMQARQITSVVQWSYGITFHDMVLIKHSERLHIQDATADNLFIQLGSSREQSGEPSGSKKICPF